MEENSADNDDTSISPPTNTGFSNLLTGVQTLNTKTSVQQPDMGITTRLGSLGFSV